MQTVSLLLCIMIAVAAADDAAARAADGADHAAKAADAGAADAGAARGADAGDAGAARGADAGDAGAARGADAGDAGAARGADAGDAGAARGADAGADHAARAAASADRAAVWADHAAGGADRAAGAARAEPACRSRWYNIDGRCFQYVPRPLTWSDAERNCQSMDSHLASVHTMKEYMDIQTYINTITLSNPQTWLGGTDCQEKDHWLWTDGSDFSGLNWCADHPADLVPSQSCLQMNSGANNCWADQLCSFTRPSICAYNL